MTDNPPATRIAFSPLISPIRACRAEPRFCADLGPRLAELITEAWRHGIAHVPCVLQPESLLSLNARITTEIALRPAELQVGCVRQRAQVGVLAGESMRQSSLAPLADEFGWLAQSHGHPLVSASFVPNEMTVMRYEGPDAGISPHRDRRIYRELVAIFSTEGFGRLDVVADRAGESVIRSCDCAPGDLVLLRAPGLGGIHDGRPIHCVHGPTTGTRTSLSLRMTSATELETKSWV